VGPTHSRSRKKTKERTQTRGGQVVDNPIEREQTFQREGGGGGGTSSIFVARGYVKGMGGAIKASQQQQGKY